MVIVAPLGVLLVVEEDTCVCTVLGGRALVWGGGDVTAGAAVLLLVVVEVVGVGCSGAAGAVDGLGFEEVLETDVGLFDCILELRLGLSADECCGKA